MLSRFEINKIEEEVETLTEIDLCGQNKGRSSGSLSSNIFSLLHAWSVSIQLTLFQERIQKSQSYQLVSRLSAFLF